MLRLVDFLQCIVENHAFSDLCRSTPSPFCASSYFRTGARDVDTNAVARFSRKCHKVMPVIRELAKRALSSSPSSSRTHLTMLSKGISRTHSFFRPHISHAFYFYGLRYFALKAVSSAPATSELTLEAASLNAISATKKKKATTKKKVLDPVNTLLTPNSVPGVQQLEQINEIPETSLNAISATKKKKTTTKKKVIDPVNTLLTPNSVPDVQQLEQINEIPEAPLNAISASKKKATTSKKKKLESVDTLLTPDSVPAVQTPFYSYKDYNPLPTVVYTQHEEEANELIAGLKAGYVF